MQSVLFKMLHDISINFGDNPRFYEEFQSMTIEDMLKLYDEIDHKKRQKETQKKMKTSDC